jgi:hypothetical protein
MVEALLETEEYRGFPIVQTLADKIVIGYIARLELQAALGASLPFYFLEVLSSHSL